MKDRIEQSSEQNIERYKQLLDQSSKNIKPSIKAQLDEKRCNALKQLETGSKISSIRWRPALAMIVPAFLLAGILFNSPVNIEQQQPATDIYTDLELLLDEDQLEFLAELEVSEWLENENENDG